MPRKKRPLNLETVRSNLAEAIEELQKLEHRAAAGHLHEEGLQVGLCHAYHHMNFAWNIRSVATREYANLSKEIKSSSRNGAGILPISISFSRSAAAAGHFPVSSFVKKQAIRRSIGRPAGSPSRDS